MKKHRALFAAVLMIAVLLCGCTKGNVGNVRTVIGNSEIYEASEIEAAMDIVISHFRSEFEGCTLTELVYDEEDSSKAAAGWAKQYHAEEAIVLISSFDVDASGGDGSLNPNSTYTGWQWILTRSSGEQWTLQTWGYG